MVKIYQRVGIPEYFIFDPPSPVTESRLWLTGYRLGPDGQYREVHPDPQGRLHSFTTNLLFGVAENGRSPEVIDAATGKTISTPSQLDKARQVAEAKAQAAEAKTQAAEKQALLEREARKVAEAEIARLRAELDRKSSS